MTPLRGILRIFKGDQNTSASAPPSDEPAAAASRNRRNAASPATGGGPILTDEPKKRRRGRRGGRGRNRGEGAPTPEGNAEGAPQARESRPRQSVNGQAVNGKSPNGKSPNGTASNGITSNGTAGNGRGRSSAKAGSTKAEPKSESRSRSRGGRSRDTSEGAKTRPTRDRYEWGRRVDSDEADQRSRQANRRRRGVRRADLDAPLPEDVAFRPGDEGGDSTILPTRRRKPIGFHDTARTLVGGARSIGTWVKRDVRHGQEPSDHDEVEPAIVEPHEEAADRNVARAARQLLVAPKAEPAPEVEAASPAEQTTEQPEARPVAGDGTEDTTDADEIDADETETDAEERPRRRRGRRGGRGRRSASAEVDGTEVDGADAAEDESAPLADADDDEGVATPSPRERQTRAARPTRTLAPVAEEDIPPAFAALKIHRTSLEQLARFGFDQPTPIQEEAIPALLNGLDVVGIAQTGSGKTIAFSVPMVEKLDPEVPEVQGIVLVPTRELAQQVLDVLTDVAAPWGLEAVGLLGGRSLKADFKALDNRPHIVVGTPGRILDHLRRQTLSLRHVRYAVLDEADQMLDIGFLPDIRRILSRTPQRRQTALFSATMPTSIRRLIWQFMTDPETVRVDAEATTVDTVDQIYFEVAQRDKVKAMRELIERELKGRSLIFCNMKRSVDHLARELGRDGVSVRALHGDLDQRQRDRVVQELRAGEIDAVIATNVAARGLDIPEITHVVNYDVPQNLEEYVHRIGRTGRAGREGKAITFVCEWDVDQFEAIRAGVPAGIRREELDLYGHTPAAPLSEAPPVEPPPIEPPPVEAPEADAEDTAEAIPVAPTAAVTEDGAPSDEPPSDQPAAEENEEE